MFYLRCPGFLCFWNASMLLLLVTDVLLVFFFRSVPGSFQKKKRVRCEPHFCKRQNLQHYSCKRLVFIHAFLFRPLRCLWKDSKFHIARWHIPFEQLVLMQRCWIWNFPTRWDLSYLGNHMYHNKRPALLNVLQHNSFWCQGWRADPHTAFVSNSFFVGFLLEVMVKAHHFPRVFNDFFSLPQAKKPDPNNETSSLSLRAWVERSCSQCLPSFSFFSCTFIFILF